MGTWILIQVSSVNGKVLVGGCPSANPPPSSGLETSNAQALAKLYPVHCLFFCMLSDIDQHLVRCLYKFVYWSCIIFLAYILSSNE